MSEQAAENESTEKSQDDDVQQQEPTKDNKFDADYVEKLRKENAKYRTEAREGATARKRLQELEDSKKSEMERAVEAAKSEGRTEALTLANTRLIGAEARALAAEAKFRNPALAVRAIDLADVTVGDDGTVDAKAIKAALKALSDAEPYLIDTATSARESTSLHSGARSAKDPESGKGRAAAALRDLRRNGT